MKAARVVIYLGEPGEQPTELLSMDITIDTVAARTLKRHPADGFWLMLHRGVAALTVDAEATETVERWLSRRHRARKPAPVDASEVTEP